MPQDHPDPVIRELLERNAEIHRRYETAKNADIRNELEKEQLAVKKTIQQVDPTFRSGDIAHDIKMHESNIRHHEEAERQIENARSYRSDD
jgi:hypothetical protein